MKVLILPSWYPNNTVNSGTFFKEQAAFLNVNGFEIKVLMAEELHTKSYFFQRIKRFFKGKSNSLTKNLLRQDPEAFSFPLIIEKGWSEEKQIEQANKNHLAAFKKLISTGWIPDLIHVQGAFKAGFAAQHISKLFNIPYVVIEHSPFNLAAYSKFRQKKIKKVLMDADKVAGVSHYQKQKMIENGIERNIDVIWNFMDETMFEIKSKTLAKDNKFVIVTITRPKKAKDVETFFKAIAVFASQHDDKSKIEVVVVGNIPINKKTLMDTEYYEKLAKKMNIFDICTIITELSRDKIAGLLQRANVFVATSIDEPYGVAIREAMLCGIPVISTRSGGPEDSITKETGILVDIRAYKDIASYLMLLKQGKLTFDQHYIREHVIAQSGQKIFLKRMIAFYDVKNY
jgi:glycosyltransferase involved in cell wall biosynthesis